MMPAQKSITTHSESGVSLDDEEILNAKPDDKHFLQFITKHKELKDAIKDESFHIHKNVDIYTPGLIPSEKCANFSDSEIITSTVSNDFLSLKISDQFIGQKLTSVSSVQCKVQVKKTLSDLSSCSIKMLQAHLEDLTRIIEEVSSELVELLQENDTLQQESNGRLVVIEQLLKMTVKNSESEVGPIMMSVISLPEEKTASKGSEEIVLQKLL